MEYFFQSVDGISGSIKTVYFSNSSNTRKYYQENILEATWGLCIIVIMDALMCKQRLCLVVTLVFSTFSNDDGLCQ